ncbi:MAG: hypothetical protein KF832_28805 [Caldilineaceae bacterium]|nr:hypothetical protein [Caldilineaceae bacterium]
MARTPNFLARQDRQHFVTCTDDGGQIRIHWRHALVRMAPSELLAMNDFFQAAIPRLQTNILLGNSLYCVIQDDQDNFEVWLLGVGFYLTPHEFQRFMQLITDSADTVRSVAELATEREHRTPRWN